MTLTTTPVALECCDSFDELQDEPMTSSDRSTGETPCAMTDPADSQGIHEVSRREKLRKIRELGFDPWGTRFDDQMAIGAIRARQDEITVELPPAGSEQRDPTQHGPKVRAAGRIVL